MSASGSFWPPMWLVCAARLKMTETPSQRLRRSISRMSPRTSSTEASARVAGFAPPPNRKPSSAVTRAARCANVWHRMEPRNPAPPVSSTLWTLQSIGGSYADRVAQLWPCSRTARPASGAGAARDLAEAEQQRQDAQQHLERGDRARQE